MEPRDITPLIERAIKIKGSQARLAEEIGCSQQGVSYLLRTKKVSAEMALAIHKATSGQVSKHELRPDIFEPEAQA